MSAEVHLLKRRSSLALFVDAAEGVAEVAAFVAKARELCCNGHGDLSDAPARRATAAA